MKNAGQCPWFDPRPLVTRRPREFYLSMIEVTTELHQRTEHPSNIDFNTDDPEAKRYQKGK